MFKSFNSFIIHLFASKIIESIEISSIKIELFNCKNFPAFQILFVNDLYPLTLASDNFTSRPGFNSAVSVNLNVSAPYLSNNSKGSIMFPFDLDIFCPFSSRIKG